MGKRIFVSGAFALLLALSGCSGISGTYKRGMSTPEGGGPAVETKKWTTWDSDEVIHGKVVQTNEAFAISGIEGEMLQIREFNSLSHAEPREGYTFLGLNFRLTNVSPYSKKIAGAMFDNYIDGSSFRSVSAIFDGSINGWLPAGETVTGYHVVEVAKDAKSLTVNFTPDWGVDDSGTVTFVFDLAELE